MRGSGRQAVGPGLSKLVLALRAALAQKKAGGEIHRLFLFVSLLFLLLNAVAAAAHHRVVEAVGKGRAEVRERAVDVDAELGEVADVRVVQ